MYGINVLARQRVAWLMVPAVLVFFTLDAHGESDRERYRNALKSYEWLLQNAITQNSIDYVYLQRNQSVLDHYLYVLGRIPYDNLQKNERLALVVNAYNAFVLRLILDYWPHIRSMTDIPDYPLPRRWKDQRWMFDGKRISLIDLKYKYLRPLKNPIAYLSLYCGAVSCPDMPPHVYRASIIDKQLDESAKRFLAQKKGMTWRISDPLLGKPRPMVYVSQLFRDYEDVFFVNGYSILAFVEEFAPQAFKAFLSEHKDKIRVNYLRFHWTVNGIR